MAADAQTDLGLRCPHMLEDMFSNGPYTTHICNLELHKY